MQNKIQYFLDKLQEESAEIIQAVSKIRRFGPDNTHPDRTTTNKQEFIGELEDFLALVAALEAPGFIDLSKNQDNIAKKLKALIG
jgi:NTP pyrophosphatase (non-canonical NTP hydrolase)